MAEVKKAAGAAKQEEVVAEKEEKYRISELIAAAEAVFGYPRECVKAALGLVKTDRMTVAEAKKRVEAFLRKEVK